MVLNYIWIAFFVIAFIVALIRLIFFGDLDVFPEMMKATFDSAETGFTISLGLTGVLTLWMGLMKIGEKAGAINGFAKLIGPFFQKIFPDLPKGHPAYGSIVMNVAANMLGLDNAATPIGLQAMNQMQETNPNKKVASNPMIMFLVLNTSGLTILPISVMVYRAQLGAVNPTDIFLPILLATFFSTLAGLVSVAIYQKINLFNKVILSYLGGLTVLVAGMIILFMNLDEEQIKVVSSLTANIILFSVIILFIGMAAIRKINVYDAFIDGAKDGFKIAIKIIPYLVAILVAIGVFRASGAMDELISFIAAGFHLFGINTDFVEALPTAFMKPLSGSGARGMMVDAMTTYGADSFVGRVASTVQGATDTTFYIIAVYFGSVGIKNTRYAVTCGLIADFVGIVASILLAYLFFH
ncbi:nucleoside recognition domain-containing protein [Saccharicrinis sp. FJH2]|uniref:nucleoside recognition domain-containing protein n=1 Tax=Saccharicrinis sp. FJH65 TaxID=3344659 RepID=UPI0035F48142